MSTVISNIPTYHNDGTTAKLFLTLLPDAYPTDTTGALGDSKIKKDSIYKVNKTYYQVVDVQNKLSGSGFIGVTLKNQSTNEIVIMPLSSVPIYDTRNPDLQKKQWADTDFRGYLGEKITPHMEDAVNYINSMDDKFGANASKVRVEGHSITGGEVQLAATQARFADSNKYHFSTYNGVPAGELMQSFTEWANSKNITLRDTTIINNVNNYCMPGDLGVSYNPMLGYYIGSRFELKADAKNPMNAHSLDNFIKGFNYSIDTYSTEEDIRIDFFKNHPLGQAIKEDILKSTLAWGDEGLMAAAKIPPSLISLGKDISSWLKNGTEDFIEGYQHVSKLTKDMIDAAEKYAEESVTPLEEAIEEKMKEVEKETEKIIEDSVDKMKDTVNKTKEKIKDDIDSVEEDINEVKITIQNEVENIAENVRDNINNTIDDMNSTIDDVKNETTKNVSESLDTINDYINKVEDMVESIAENITENVKNTIDINLDHMKSNINYIRNYIEERVNELKVEWEKLEQVVDFVGEKVREAVEVALPGYKNIVDILENYFNYGQKTISPLVIDINDDGIQTISRDDNVYFDFDSNGFAENTGWISPNDGLLVFDRNENGKIDNGTELFGENTPGNSSNGGFEALAQFDANADGVVNAGDDNFDKLQVWVDRNLNGKSESDELYSLSDCDIISINLNYQPDNAEDEFGNIIAQRGSFDKSDYTTGAIVDIRFSVEKASTRQIEILDIPQDIEDLPKIKASGNVYDLQQAMVRDESGELKALVEQFIAETDKNVRHELTDQIIFKWTSGENLDPNGRDDGWFDIRKLNAIEQFMGQQFQNQNNYIGPGAVTFLSPAYEELHKFIYSELMSQSHLQNLYSLLKMEFDTETGNIIYNKSDLIAELQNQIALDEQTGKDMLSEFALTVHGFKISTLIGYQEVYDTFSVISQDYKDMLDAAALLSSDTVTISNGQVGDYDENIVGDENDNIINGYGGNDFIYGEQGNDLLNGGDGNDAIEGDTGELAESGSDILEGGKGNDYLDGGIGNDIYKFNLGDGQDVINDTASYKGDDRFRYIENIDVIQFGDGITKDDIEVAIEGSSLRDGSLVIKIKGTDDQIKILSQFDYDS